MGDTVFLSILTGGEAPHFALPSCAEAVVTVIFHGRDHRWFDLLAFSVLPDEVQLVVTPRMQKPDSIVRNLQGQTTPLIAALVRTKGDIWERRFRQKDLDSPEAVQAQIENVHRTPVIMGLSKHPRDYPFCSASPRYRLSIDAMRQ